MERKKSTQILLTAAFTLTLMGSLVGCGAKQEAVKADKNPQKIVQDKNYTADLKNEKDVQAGQVYVQNGTAIGTMIIKKGVSDADVKKLAEKYAKELKETYKDLKVNVQAVEDGKNVADITLNK
jgi:ABC-type phosphate transport system substrate-binding protein